MATTKQRINISVSDAEAEFLTVLAKRDQMPRATKVRQLLQLALEIEEDAYLAQIAQERDTPDATYISHEDFWEAALSGKESV